MKKYLLNGLLGLGTFLIVYPLTVFFKSDMVMDNALLIMILFGVIITGFSIWFIKKKNVD